jgi:hypothetical protein
MFIAVFTKLSSCRRRKITVGAGTWWRLDGHVIGVDARKKNVIFLLLHTVCAAHSVSVTISFELQRSELEANYSP